MDKQPPDIPGINELVASVTEEANQKATNPLSTQSVPQQGEITSLVKHPLAEAQENTRALLAIAVAIGLGILIYFLLLLSAVNQAWTYILLSQRSNQFTPTELRKCPRAD